ncbi:hypothetical protein Lalb_Chr04g0261241 [Lupinus albus]|uniref:Uncharacterized protein n=1 Tax=Lupinus albus TaxID=3870 RepID=A0A6A4QQP0_LUPAL|nr:hypothetical protein Lalb_Chr04g0261241 [Lupinus albus]
MCDQVGKFLPQLVDVGKLMRNVPKEIAEINEELESIQVSMNAADRMIAIADEQVNESDIGMKRNVKHMREAALRIGEVTKDYMSIQQQPPSSNRRRNFLLHTAPEFVKTMIPRLRISYEIQGIKSSILKINERSCLYKVPSSGCYTFITYFS